MSRSELAAFADMFAAAPPALGAASMRIDAALAMRVPGIPARELNRVVGPLADLDAVAAFYGGAPHMVCGGDGIEDELAARGYRRGYAWMLFSRPTDAAAHAETDLRIETVGPDRADDFAGPVRTGFGMPPVMHDWLAAHPGRPGWTCLVGYDGDAPVSAGAVFVDGDEAWLGFGATLPDARGRGGQGAILARRLALAAQQGAVTATTETGVVEDGRPARSYRNILRAGFAEAGVRENWDHPG